MDKISKVIGEGTYGCIHSPSLFCQGSTQQEINKISKLMTTEEATKEMKEYVIIDNADRAQNFYLGKPTKCKLDKNPKNMKAISKCINIGDEVLIHYDDYSLLIMDNGGIDLDKFSKNVEGWADTTENKKKMEMFWLEAHRILLGLKVFLDNGIIHNDMKQQNIVYNEAENRLNFIDFGLMSSKTKVEASLRNSDFWLAIYHWSFPLEFGLLNRDRYNTFSLKSPNEKTLYVDKLIKGLSPFHNDTKASEAISIFFSQISNAKKAVIRKAELNILVTDFSKTMLNQFLPGPENYTKFMNKALNTLDSYGVGMAYMHVLKNSTHLIDIALKTDLYNLFYSMFNPDQSQRLEIDDILISYENILEKNGILQKYDKHFIDHIIKDGPAIPVIIEKAIEKIDVQDIILNETELAAVAISPQRICPAEKEFNPKSKRCINKCKNGFFRDPSFKCKKNITLKSSAKKSAKRRSVKDCPIDKERNPKTKRCVKKCKSNYTRDVNFKCKKI